MKIKSMWLRAELAVIIAAFAAGCSSNEGSFYEYLSTEDAAVASVSLRGIADNAGFEIASDGSVTPSEAFTSIAKESDEGWLLEAVKIQGVDLDKAMASYAKASHTKAIVLTITDKSKLEKYLADNGFEGAGEGIYSRDDLAFVVDGDHGVLINVEASKARKAVDQMKATAKKTPLQTWQKELLEANVSLTVLAPSDVAQTVIGEKMPEMKGIPGLPSKKSDKGEDSESYMVMTCNLNEADLECSVYECTADGTRAQTSDEGYPGATSLLQYATSDDAMVMLLGLPKKWDYGSIVNQNIDGTGERMIVSKILKAMRSIMIAAGPKAGTAADNPMNWNAVLAIEFADSKANELFGMLRMVSRQIGATNLKVTADEITLDYGEIPVKAQRQGNIIIVSMNPAPQASGAAIAQPSTFDGTNGGIVVNFASDSSIAKTLNLPWGVDAKVFIVSGGVNLNIKLTDAKEKFLESIISIID